MAEAINGAMARERAESQLELKKRRWFAARRWQRDVATCLASTGVTFTEWLVLDATWSLVRRTGSAVNQTEVAANLELDAMTLWHAMVVLEHRGLLSRSRSMSGKAWRAFVTSEGVNLLRALEPSLEAASTSGRSDTRLTHGAVECPIAEGGLF